MKTYCISDIHGHLENLQDFLCDISDDDKVYVLGDVIDKGYDSIECLKVVMNDSRCHMLLGNHEYMMYNYLTTKVNTMLHDEAYEQWLIYNEGPATLDEYLDLDEEERKEILNFITNLPLNYPDVEVNGKHFYLVHAMPKGLKQVTMKDLNYNARDIADYVWNRFYGDNPEYVEGRIVITGHTPVLAISDEVKPYYLTEDIEDARFIDIDGSLATRLSRARLIALCLDDMSYKLY